MYDYLWLDKGLYLADSQEATNPFAGKWTYVESKDPQWYNLTHVDIWSVVQYLVNPNSVILI